MGETESRIYVKNDQLKYDLKKCGDSIIKAHHAFEQAQMAADRGAFEEAEGLYHDAINFYAQARRGYLNRKIAEIRDERLERYFKEKEAEPADEVRNTEYWITHYVDPLDFSTAITLQQMLERRV